MDVKALRGQLGRLISGFDGEEPDGFDPFSAPNEWEERKREQKLVMPKHAASDEMALKSTSRRAQQATRKAALQPNALDSVNGSEPFPDVQVSKPRKSYAEGGFKSAASDTLRTKLPVCANWWEELVPPPVGAHRVSVVELEVLQARAEILYEGEVKAQALAEQKKHGSDHKMIKKLMSAGTAKDKIAALTVQVQESSFHCLPFLRQLVGWTERPAKEVKMAAVEAVSELFLNRLLPPRALVPLHKQPLGDDPSDLHVLQAYFESELKSLYATFAEVVLAGLSDSVVHFKQVQQHLLCDVPLAGLRAVRSRAARLATRHCCIHAIPQRGPGRGPRLFEPLHSDIPRTSLRDAQREA